MIRSKRIPEKEKEKAEKKQRNILVQFKPKFPEIFSINESFFAKSFVEAINNPQRVCFFHVGNF